MLKCFASNRYSLAINILGYDKCSLLYLFVLLFLLWRLLFQNEGRGNSQSHTDVEIDEQTVNYIIQYVFHSDFSFTKTLQLFYLFRRTRAANRHILRRNVDVAKVEANRYLTKYIMKSFIILFHDTVSYIVYVYN